MTAPTKRTLKVEKLARIYDAEIAPCWGTRFARLLLRDLVLPERSQVLDVACGTGYPTIEILRRMTEGSRLIAIDESGAMLDVVRRKVAELGPLGKKGVFLRTERALPRLSFADEVYDLVVCNLGLGDMPSIADAVRDFARVTKPGGEIRCTLPLAGTFAEFHDLYREVLVKHDQHDALDRLAEHIACYPTFEQLEHCLDAADLTGRVEVEEFALLFRSARELFFAPVIEYGPLAEWKAIAGGGQEMQDVFWYIKEAIDAYFGDRPFHVTVKAACVIGRKAERTLHDRDIPGLDQSRGHQGQSHRVTGRGAEPVDPITTPVRRDVLFDTDEGSAFDQLDTSLPWPPRGVVSGTIGGADPGDDVEELGSKDIAFEEDLVDDPDLDAFIAGKKRPHHLAE